MKKQKVCLIGDEGVGKTSLVERHTLGTFSNNYKSTIGVKIHKKTLFTNGEEVKLIIWDLQGGVHSKSNYIPYLIGSNAFIFVASLSNTQSIDNLTLYLSIIKQEFLSAKYILCLNKTDLAPVQFQQIQKPFFSHFSNIFYTSAKTNTGVEESFKCAAL